MPQDLTPKRLPLVIVPSNRDTSTSFDARLVNAYLEKDDYGQYWIRKRPGLSLNTSLAGGAGAGVYNWKGDIYAVAGTTLYKNGSSIGTVDGTGGVYRFSSTLGTTRYLFLSNGVKAYTYDGTTLAATAASFNAILPTVKGSAYLDGFTYVMDATAHIYNDDVVNTPGGVWTTATNMILAQVEPDGGVFLAKQLVYVVAFKQWTTEIFYDAGNTSGSPLAAVQGAKVAVGCPNGDSVQSIDDVLFFLTTSRTAHVGVGMLEQVKFQSISSKAVERLLDDSTLATVYSWTLKDEGHEFYGVTCVDLNRTLVYDKAEQLWSQWTDASGNYLPIVASTFVGQQQHLVQLTNGSLYTLDSQALVDVYPTANSIITVDIYTPNFDGGNRWNKVMQRLDFVADQVPGSWLDVRVSDDDYRTWSNPRRIDLSLERPSDTDWGTFRRRAHHFRHARPTTFRIQAVEYDLLQGAA